MVAITGATGLLGGHILERFLAEGVDCVALHRLGQNANFPDGVIKRPADVLEQVSLVEAFKGVTTVVHAAAFVSFNPRRREKIFRVNVEGTRHVVNACLQLGIKNLIHISSVAALGRKPGENISEESKWTGMYSSDYAESKYMAELEVFRGAEEGLSVSIVNPSVILSGTQPGRSSAVLFNYVWDQKKFYTAGSLNYVDARDVAEAVCWLYHHPQPGEKFILSAGNLPYQEFFLKVANRFSKKAPSIKISTTVAWWAGWLDELRAGILNEEPLVTRQSARMAMHSFQYDHKKVKETMGLQFRPLEDTIASCCENYERNVKANK